ncbi:MAG: diacylglycerol kinase family protein [candidate division WOR-3 bacterium]|nr:diacylglycerol kinase family protein [candidate division WOR-3 bacterium]
MTPLPLVLLNPGCNYRTGAKRWARVEPELRLRLGGFDVEELRSESEVRAQVQAALGRGVRVFIVAGGDGTVNLVANALLEPGAAPEVTLGAVGLGSSNDFHKPFRKEDFIGRMPVRVDLERARPVDVIRIEYEDPQSRTPDLRPLARYCLLNASIGITAEGNAFFNTRTMFIRLLQRVSHNLAVTATALRTMFVYKNIPCRLQVDDSPAAEFAITNLGVIKRPNFAGSLRYDTPIAPDDGRLGVNLSYGLSLPEKVATLAALSGGRFWGRPKTLCLSGARAVVTSPERFAVELDGEIVYARLARFSVIPKAMKVCL